MRSWLALAACALVAGCASPESAPYQPRGETRAVLAELEGYYQDLSNRDWEALPDRFWPGATITTVHAPEGEDAPRVFTVSAEEFIAKGPEGPGSMEIFEERMETAEVELQDGLAQAWVHYWARFGNEGQVERWTGIDAFTLVKHEGRWRITSLSFAPTR